MEEPQASHFENELESEWVEKMKIHCLQMFLIVEVFYRR